MALHKFEQWTVEETCQYLEKEGLGQWADKFKERKITGDWLRGLTVANLKGMGIEQLDDCEKILLCIGKLWQIPGKVFNDPIHGHVELHPLLIKIIDTPEFQRLRYIKQLGGVYFVYPGASHNRFEHSIGVAHLAGKLVQSLSAQQPELGITHRDVLCVQIAGLCHDLGHGPFSHMFDSMFIPKVDPKTEWKHEKASCLMFDHLVEHNNLEMEEYGLVPSEDTLFIKEMIVGPLEKNTAQDQEWPYEGRGKEKSFLYEIVANKRNGIDVDKFDYFARDCYHLGVQNNFDYRRFLKFARVCEVEMEEKGENKEERKEKKAKDKVKGEKKFEKQICIRDKEVYNLYNMFHTRYCIHRRACQHRVSSIIQTMIADAFVKADEHFKIEGSSGKTFTLSKAIDDMGAYIKVTDCVFEQILNSTSPDLKEASNILRRIITRDLYRCLGEIGIKLSNPEEGICDDLKTELTQQIPGNDEAVSRLTKMLLSEKLKKEDFEVVHISMDYGMGYEDPIEKVRFYSKDEPNKGFKLQREQVSNVLPTYFSDELIRVYYKGNKEELNAAKEYFEEWWKEQNNNVGSHRCNNSDRTCISKIYLINHAPVPDEAATPGPSTE